LKAAVWARLHYMQYKRRQWVPKRVAEVNFALRSANSVIDVSTVLLNGIPHKNPNSNQLGVSTWPQVLNLEVPFYFSRWFPQMGRLFLTRMWLQGGRAVGGYWARPCEVHSLEHEISAWEFEHSQEIQDSWDRGDPKRGCFVCCHTSDGGRWTCRWRFLPSGKVLFWLPWV